MSVAAPTTSIEQLAINTIRTLSMDAVQKANSGHPGTPMALAPVTYQLWQHNLRYDPSQPLWPGRDRFVLSCGHASMLLYSMLHLTGVRKVAKHDNSCEDGLAITLDDIKNFRQLHSPCAGHPGIRRGGRHRNDDRPARPGRAARASAWRWPPSGSPPTTTGPGFELFENRVYVLCSDGDLMEGISSEAASRRRPSQAQQPALDLRRQHDHDRRRTPSWPSAKTWRRGSKATAGTRIRVDDANDLGAIQRAIDSAKKVTDKPTIIVLKSIIGYGSPNKANTHAAHGAPLGAGRDQAHQESSTAGRKTPSSSCPTKCASILPAGIGAQRQSRPRSSGRRNSPSTQRRFPRKPPS